MWPVLAAAFLAGSSVFPHLAAQSIHDALALQGRALTATTDRAPAALPTSSSVGWAWNRRSLKDWRLSDLAIVSTLDGSLHALERDSGETRWTISSADTSIRSSRQGNASAGSVLDGGRDTWIVEPIDEGCLYTFNTKEGLYKLPFGIRQLVENSPFTVPGDDKVYVGERRTTLYSIDPRSGNVLQAYGTGYSHVSSTAPKCPTRDSLDELDDDDECQVSDPYAKDILKIGRNTYTLTVFLGSETLWNITYTEWVPNSIDADLERQYAGTFDGQYISPLYDGKVIAHQTETNDAVWFKDLGAPAIRVYDVLHQYHTHARGYADEVEAVALVAQPLDPHFAEIDHENYVDGGGSTYIGRTEHGDWFALSAAKCPLVSSAPLSRWSAGTSSGSTDDLLGIHTHNKVTDQQSGSPGHLLTIEDTTTTHAKLLDDYSQPRLLSMSLWLVTICMLVLGSLLGLQKFKVSKQISPIYHHEQASRVAREQTSIQTQPIQRVLPEVDLSLEQDVQPPIIGKSLPSIPPETFETKSTTLTFTESVKPKRKRGSRGGKRLREAAQKALDDRDVLEQDKSEHDGEDKIIDTIPAVPIPSTTTGYPLQINALTITDRILGYGSHGTIVYKGSFEGRDVAVKRMLLDFYDIASHEVGLLQESDDHPNVIRYYCKQENERFLYIALELCTASLAEVTERPSDYQTLSESMVDLISVLRQMAQGIQYLHSLKIVHRDLKPQNILVNPPRKSVVSSNKTNCARLVISDFGLCKKLDADQSSFRATTAQAAGTSGWRAPELLLDDSPDPKESVRESSTSGSALPNGLGIPRKVSRAIDIFSLGCVFYYVLSNGSHPFGDRYMREANIIRDKFSLEHLDILGDIGVLAKDLIGQMISANPKNRPDATSVLQHPFFWSSERRLNFLLDISDRFEIEERDPPSPLLQMLEEKAPLVVSNNWYTKLDKNFIENLGKYRKYYGHSILDLLRALRNKKHHYQDLPENVQSALGPLPHGFLNYFCSRFPLLLLHTYYLARDELSEEAMFYNYYS